MRLTYTVSTFRFTVRFLLILLCFVPGIGGEGDWAIAVLVAL